MGVAFRVIGTLVYLKNEGMNWAYFLSVRKAKSSAYMYRVKYDCDLLGPEILKSALSQDKLMNWANILRGESDVITFY